MKRLFKYIFLLPLLLVVSCVYDEGLSIEDVLKVSDNTFEFTAAGDEIEFTIESYCGWEIKCEADWVSFSDYEGDSKDVKNVLTVSENLSLNARTVQAEIVNYRYGINIKLNISQEAGVPYIKTSSERLELDYEGGLAEIKVSSSVPWEASVDVDWIEISPKSGESGVCTMTIVVGENVLEESREGIITLKNEEYSLTMYVKIQQNKGVPNINGYEYVDLGLPSGLKWATCNVGASSPEEYGDYYAWGEIETKSEYYESNSKTRGKLMSDISGNSIYDVARAKWGGSWRLPTKKEMEELINECEWKWATINDKIGCKVTGPNGNSIFLPVAGCRYWSLLDYEGWNGYYWSSTPYESDDYSAYDLEFNSSERYVYWGDRSNGQSVRPVSE